MVKNIKNLHLSSMSMAVVVKEAYKLYANKCMVVRGLNMKIKEGTIYSLLGPSGCGKTTLLNSLLGQNKLDSGDIFMKTNYRSQIGYMPQDLSLYQEFSIKEHMMYYGYIYNMEKTDIIIRTRELLDFLELPNMQSIISELSGGEQRRVSLCIALLHDPQLLILDEPTVGVDVLLRNRIWQKFLEMSSWGKTILITTHYVEEARLSNTIALMRNGKILEEDEPSNIMEQHNTTSLEEAFFKLCKQEQNGNECEDSKAIQKKIVRNPGKNHYLKNSNKLSWSKIYAHLYKDIHWMRRNISLVLFILVLPIVQCTIISLTVGEDPNNISIALANKELHNCSKKQLDIDCETGQRLSCVLARNLKRKSLEIVEYNSIKSAVKAARENKVWGVIFINSNYSVALLNRIQMKTLISTEGILQSEIAVSLDMSSQVIGTVTKRHITNSVLEMIEQVCKHCNLSSRNSGLHLKIENPVFGRSDPSFRQFMTPANAVLFEFFLPMMFTLGAMLMEKTSGLLERSLIAGISHLEIALGHIILQYFILLIQTSFMLFVLFWIFDNPLEGSIASCLFLLLLVGTCGMFFGFFVAASSASFTTSACVTIGTYFPLFLLSGSIWPIEGMHYVLRYISHLLPLTTSVESFRALSVRSWTITHPVVYQGILSLVSWTIIFYLLTFAAVKFKGIK